MKGQHRSRPKHQSIYIYSSNNLSPTDEKKLNVLKAFKWSFHPMISTHNIFWSVYHLHVVSMHVVFSQMFNIGGLNELISSISMR